MANPAGIPSTAVQVTGVASPNTALQMAALAVDAQFRARFQGLLIQMAAQILLGIGNAGTPGVIGTGSSSAAITGGQQTYARAITNNPGQYLSSAILWIVVRGNLTGANLWVDLAEGSPHLYTDATDAAILAQLNSDWGFLAGA